MKTWPLQDAKNQFSQVVELAQTDGPQTVTKQGEPVAVVVSAGEFKRRARPKESVLEFFAPLKGSGIRLKRNRDLPRNREL
ncbi:MAG: type II toxin-antitoxin system Phd/YefM family antitoxin [Verrucomicrobia bacterium]|nr:type II toxin-antitoxin system Phd/YefM family antitoxin [Verrucomicrobiota bacterium]